MTITINDMIAISHFLDAHRADKMSMKTAFRLNKLATALEPDMRLFQEKYRAIIEQYADLTGGTEPDGMVKIPQEKFSEYAAAIEELSAVEIEVPDIKFSIDEFEDCKLSLDEIRPLMNFIEE